MGMAAIARRTIEAEMALRKSIRSFVLKVISIAGFLVHHHVLSLHFHEIHPRWRMMVVMMMLVSMIVLMVVVLVVMSMFMVGVVMMMNKFSNEHSPCYFNAFREAERMMAMRMVMARRMMTMMLLQILWRHGS